ncbi:VBP1 [Symbiodinium sp. CCMP2456]|nr:VBP1 [Symbiodinium sp. CCMP2456]
MQSSLTAQRSSLKTKLPDISAALEVVEHLVSKSSEASEDEPTQYTYQLAENIWSKASAPPSKTVCLWLGANCMLEYTLDEALDLLKTNENNARSLRSMSLHCSANDDIVITGGGSPRAGMVIRAPNLQQVERTSLYFGGLHGAAPAPGCTAK